MDRLFLYFYLFDNKGNERGGMHYVGYADVTEEDLGDLNIAIPKIKKCIDQDIADHERWLKEKLAKQKKMKWTGRTFKRGDFVHFKGNDKYISVDTYVWTFFGHMMLEYYIVEHPQGKDMYSFTNKPPFRRFGIGADGFESVHSSQLQEGLKYIAVHCKEFQFETDELVMLKEAEANVDPKPLNLK